MESRGSHIATLEKAVRQTAGPILEMGVGPHSTPLLNELAVELDRHVTSYETNEEFYEIAEGYQNRWHDVRFVNHYNDADICTRRDGVWGVAFFDHAPGSRRIVDMLRVREKAIFVVCHDSEDGSDCIYHYSEIMPLFKYRFDSVGHPVQTSVLSMFKEFRA